MSSVLTFLGLAITDAMNPFTVATMAMLLALDRAVARGVIFAATTFVIYLIYAVLLAEGWTAAIASLRPMLPEWVPGALLLVVAVVCIGFASRLWTSPPKAGAGTKLAKALTLSGTAVFAIVSTLSDLPTAVPLFAAVAQLQVLADGRLGQYAWLTGYTLVYVAPLLLLLGLRVALGMRADAALARVLSGVEWGFRHLLPPVLLIAGGVAGWSGIARLAAGV